MNRQVSLKQYPPHDRIDIAGYMACAQVAGEIRRTREALRLTARDLAKLIGSCPSTIFNYEDPDYTGMRVCTVAKIMEALLIREETPDE